MGDTHSPLQLTPHFSTYAVSGFFPLFGGCADHSILYFILTRRLATQYAYLYERSAVNNAGQGRMPQGVGDVYIRDGGVRRMHGVQSTQEGQAAVPSS